jgi:hypothetical protein
MVRGRRHRPPWGDCADPCALFHLRVTFGPITGRASLHRILLDGTAGSAPFHAEIFQTAQPSHIGNFRTAQLLLH